MNLKANCGRIMCINNTPSWILWVIILSVPVALLIINLVLAKYISTYGKYKLAFIIGSVVLGIIWFSLWYLNAFLTRCV
jgi:hypothetical protein